MVTRAAPRPRASCREPGVDSTCSRPPSERHALAHAGEPERVLARRLRVEARAVVLDDGDDRAVLPLQQDADPRAPACLAMFVSASWIDPVERRLGLARQPLLAELRSRSTSRPLCSRNVSVKPLDCGDEPEVVERRRAQLDREPAHVLQRRDDELAEGRDRLARPRSACCSSGLSPSRIDVSAWPVSSCSSRASRARSSSCASTTRRTASRLTRSERSTAIAARAASDSASRRSSSLKAGVGPSLSCAMTTPIARPRTISGT